jgi:hypothetical protein
MDITGVLFVKLKEGAFSGDDFLDWLRGTLAIMNPYPQPRSVLLIDNCKIHHVAGVQQLCEEV